jgi:hypothetical protein
MGETRDDVLYCSILHGMYVGGEGPLLVGYSLVPIFY